MSKSDMPPLPTDQVWAAMREFDYSGLFAGGERSMKAFADAHGHFFASMAKMNQEIAGFVERRMEHDRMILTQLASCKSPQEAMSVWGSFVQTAANHYAEEMRTMTALGFDHAREVAEEVQHEMSEATGAMAKAGKIGP